MNVGKIYITGSCHPSCEKTGECCSDYQICEIIEKSHSIDCLEPNCKLCTRDRKVCLQCKDNFFYYNSKCVLNCPQKTQASSQNICESVKNSKCSQGLFFHKGKCLHACPVGLRANRIDFTCKTDKEFAFYWVFPSRESCENKCGDNTKSDCSCKFTCLRRGNCCDNFEKECNEEMKKEKCSTLCDKCVDGKCLECKPHSILNGKNKCKCMKNYNYILEEDICVSNKMNKNESLKDNLKNLENINRKDLTETENIIFLVKSQRKKKKSQKEDDQPKNIGLDLNTQNKPLFFTNNTTNSIESNYARNYSHLSSSLTSHLKSTFFKLLNIIKSNPETKANPMSFYLNGNMSFNIMNNNVGTRIINRNNLKVNSNNLNARTIENINSNNNVNKITKQGNVIKNTNSGGIYRNNVLPINRNADEKIYRKLDLNNKHNYISHEQIFGDPSSLEIQRIPEINKIKENSISNNSTNPPILQKEQSVFNNDNNSFIRDEIKQNNTLYTVPSINLTNPYEFQTNKNFQTISPQNNSISVLKKTVNKQISEHSFAPNDLNSSLDSDKNALIVGRGNSVKNNHLIHNIITVHNSYIIPAHNLSRLMNNTENGLKGIAPYRRVIEINKDAVDKK